MTVPLPSQQLADLVAQLRRAMRRAARLADPAQPLAVAQLELLSSIGENPGIRPGELARALRLARNSVTTLVNALVAQGMIERSNGDGDRRAVHLSLTEAGAQAVAHWARINSEIVGTALGQLPGRDRIAIERALPALHTLVRLIDSDDEAGSGGADA